MGKKEVQSETVNNHNPHVNPSPNEFTDSVFANVTPYEREYLQSMASILNKIEIDGNKILKHNSIGELVRVCLTYTCTIYQNNVFPDSTIVTKLPDRESVKEFIAFRKKYMNYPIQAQINQLKEMGIVKPKPNQKEQQQQQEQKRTV